MGPCIRRDDSRGWGEIEVTEGSRTPLYCDYALLVAKLVSFLSLKGREVPTEISRPTHPLAP
jgi:hypothetical protein